MWVEATALDTADVEQPIFSESFAGQRGWTAASPDGPAIASPGSLQEMDSVLLWKFQNTRPAGDV